MRQNSETRPGAVLCPAKEAIGRGDPEALDGQMIVLRTVVENFGGEVVRSTLRQHLAEAIGSQALGSGPWLQRILAGLEHCGALTLDAVDETEVVVRLSPKGTALLDGMAAAGPGTGHFGAKYCSRPRQ